MADMHYFVNMNEVQDPEVHGIDVYIGETTPDLPEGSVIQEFTGEGRLQLFLMRGEWDKATIYKSPGCPQELVDDLAEWMTVNMSLESIITVGGEDGS